MQRYAKIIDDLESMTDVLELVRDACLEQGAKRMSYHFSPIFDEPVSLRTVIYSHGYEPEWLKEYERAEFRMHDPIPERTFRHGEAITWVDAMGAAPNTPENEAYFDAMRAAGLIHGFGMPLYGARGREAYASFDFGRRVAEVDPEKVGFVRGLAQFAHVRICNLVDREIDFEQLSLRETEVLTWMAKGKTAQDIGKILSLSPETIRTYIKRLYEKMGTHDRIGAVVRGLKLGLIRI